MRSLLTDETHQILHIRVYIAKTTNIFNLSEIARGWEMSRHTLYRYIDEEYRRQSRELAQKTTQRLKSAKRGLCYKCQEPLKSHARCTHCEILTHGETCSCVKHYGIIHV